MYQMMTTMRGGQDEEREAAYTAAFQELFPRAVRLAARILGDRSAAEDVAAEAMTRAYSAWDRIGSAPAYRTGWTLRVATNLAIDVVRRRERASDLSGPSEDLAGGPFGVDGPGGRGSNVVPDISEDLVLRVALVAGLRELPRRQREAVAMRYLAGLSQAEVAKSLGVSPGTVARHVHRGLATLRGRFEELAPRGSEGRDVTELLTGKDRPMKIETLRDAVPLRGSDTLVTAHVTGVMPGEWGWIVDIGVPAVLRRGDREREAGDDPTTLIGQDVECLVAEVDLERERVLVTAPGDGQDEESLRRREIIGRLRPGEVRSGHVHALVPFGAFVDIGGAYGLVHVRDLGTSVGHPGEVLTVGQPLRVEVVEANAETQRVSLRPR